MSILPRASLLAIAVIALPLLGAGCSMPFQVAYIDDPSAEIRGIRYKLKRPAYAVGLQLDLKETEVFDGGAGLYVAGPRLGCPEGPCPNRNPVLSIKGKPRDLCIITKLDATILVVQTLSKTMTFEIRNDDPGSIIKILLADSQLSVTVDDDGYLTSVDSKVDDQILPFVEVVAGLTVSIAKGAAIGFTPSFAPPAPGCFLEQMLGLDPDQLASFRSYMYRHVSLAAQKRRLEAALARIETALTTAPPGDLKGLLEGAKHINDELAKLSEALKIVSYDIPDTKYILTIDGDQVVNKNNPASNWVEIDLTSGR